MPTSYVSRFGIVESDLYDCTPVPPKTKAKVLATVLKHQSARVEESLDLVRDQTSSVQNVFEYGLRHPGGVSAKQIQTALGLSDKSVKTAHKVLQELQLAGFEATYYRGGRSVLWRYDTGLRGLLVDLDSGKRSDHDSGKQGSDAASPSHDRWITPTTCENDPILGQEEGRAVVGGESLSLCLELSDQGVKSTETPSPPVVARERRRRSWALETESWTTTEFEAAPVLARYRELIESKGFVVYEDHAMPIWHQLALLVENHGLTVAHEFLDHVERACDHPYRANAMASFERRWWSLDRAEAQPAPTKPVKAPESRSEDVNARNDRLRAMALGMRRTS